jgi:hypothetical protein
MARFVDEPEITRLRAARPPEAVPDAADLDLALLDRVRSGPPPRRRGRRRGGLALAAVAVAVAAAIVLVDGPSGVQTPATADAAVRKAQRWFAPASGGVLHYRSEIVSAGVRDPLVQEIWQSVDDPAQSRHFEHNRGVAVEGDGSGALYDPATDTIYVEVRDSARERRQMREAFARKLAGAKAAGASRADLRRMRREMDEALRAGPPPAAPGGEPLGDPTVTRVRELLERGLATVGPETTHGGIPAHAITLRPDAGREPRWVLWTATSDGRPLELRIDHGPGTAAVQTTRWPVYELLGEAPLTVRGAHPGATVVRDAEAYADAQTRLFPGG